MEFQGDLSELPKSEGWFKQESTLYQGVWVWTELLQNIIALQREFRAEGKDVIFASHPKCGTTWLKALLFSIVNRHVITPADSPLLTQNPHTLVQTLEFVGPRHTSLEGVNLLATHVPYALMPGSITDEGSPESRVVYICRNPLDTIVSFWKFSTNTDHPSFWPDMTLEECVEVFCRGESGFGPFWAHVLGFWKASLERPEKVLFLKYEDVLEDTCLHVKKIAGFVGFPFSPEEESNGVVEGIIELCSLKKMKEYDVNKHGKMSGLESKIFFRNGQVGDWVNHLSPSMVEKVNNVIEEKLHGSGLTFTYYPKNI